MTRPSGYLFQAYLDLITNGKTADEAKAILTELFPAQAAMLPAILDNAGDMEAAQRQYTSDLIRAARERKYGQRRITIEVDSAAIRGRAG